MPREEYQRALTAGDDRRTQIALQHQTFDSFLSYSFPPQFLCHTCSHILFSSSSHVDRVSSIIHNQSTLEKKDRLLFFFFLFFVSFLIRHWRMYRYGYGVGCNQRVVTLFQDELFSFCFRFFILWCYFRSTSFFFLILLVFSNSNLHMKKAKRMRKEGRKQKKSELWETEQKDPGHIHSGTSNLYYALNIWEMCVTCLWPTRVAQLQ